MVGLQYEWTVLFAAGTKKRVNVNVQDETG